MAIVTEIKEFKGIITLSLDGMQWRIFSIHANTFARPGTEYGCQ